MGGDDGRRRAADTGPWDSIWLFDHFHTVPEPARETVFEAWTATAALARDTQRVKLGQMVGCNGYRNPALYAKMAGTVDVAATAACTPGWERAGQRTSRRPTAIRGAA